MRNNFLFLCAVGLLYSASVSSGRDLLGERQEVDPCATITTPITHSSYYLHEREIQGYSPIFPVNSVQFDSHNRPYIREENAVVTFNSYPSPDEYIVWERFDFSSTIAAHCSGWDGTMRSWDSGGEDRIVFDDMDHAYMIVDPTGFGYHLMFSTDLCRTWTIYDLPTVSGDTGIVEGGIRLEGRQSNSDGSKPPVITFRMGRTSGSAYMGMYLPTKSGSGPYTLTVPSRVYISGGVTANGLNTSKGAGNLTAAKGNKVHVVYPARYVLAGTSGTPYYANTWDRSSSTWENANWTLIATVGLPAYVEGQNTLTDGHNWPAIVLDNNTNPYLHVTLGCHGTASGQKFKYARSSNADSGTNNNTTTSWTNLTDLSGNTYNAFLMDGNGVGHLISRDHYGGGAEEMQCLVYERFASGSWASPVKLVKPFDDNLTDDYAPYTHFAQNINVDRSGNLYATYWVHRAIDELETEQKAVAETHWPCDPLTLTLVEGTTWRWEPAKWRDPVILTSTNGGVSWRIAKTSDFAAAYIP